MARVMVSVPVTMYVNYELEVEDPDNLEEIIEKLLNHDASDWAEDPDFYEVYGSKFRECVMRLTREDVQVLEE